MRIAIHNNKIINMKIIHLFYSIQFYSILFSILFSLVFPSLLIIYLFMYLYLFIYYLFIAGYDSYDNDNKINIFIIYPRNCPVQFALLKTFNKFLYLHGVKENSLVLYGFKEVRSQQNYFCLWPTWRKNLAANFLCRLGWKKGETTELTDAFAK